MSNKAFKVKHGLELPNGTPVDEFSIDGTMVGLLYSIIDAVISIELMNV